MPLAAAAAAKAARGARYAWLALRSPTLAPALTGSLAFILALLFIDPLASYEPEYSTSLYAAGGELLAARTARDGQWRLERAEGAEPPERYRLALVAYEDRSFYGHAGFDPKAIARALRDNLTAGRIVSGGSTLSMQLARLSRPSSRRDLAAKAAELWAALRLELFHTKDEIAELYAERAPYGGNVVGLEAAGFRWFGRSPTELSWAEAATLAVLPNSPGLVHPGRSRDELKRKRDGLLAYLAGRGLIDSWTLSSALAEPLPGEPKPMPELAMHAAAALPPGSHDSSLDYALQARVTAAAERHAARLSLQGVRNVAAVVARVSDGAVVAYVGNARTAGVSGSYHVDCAVAPRSSGSILKPFLYAAMLDSGELGPTRLVADVPTRIGSYSPENNLKTFSGAVRADEALARSLNVPFVRLLRSYGVERFGALLTRLGFSTLKRAHADYGLTLVLGGAEASLVDAAGAYALLSRTAQGLEPAAGAQFTGVSWRAKAGGSGGSADGIVKPPAGGVKPPAGGTTEPPAAGGFVAPGAALVDAPLSRGAAWLTLDALTQVARPGDEASWHQYASSLKVAWKTGTSFGARDAWAIGVTAEYVVAVWAGNANGVGRPGLSGTDAAAPLLFELFGLLPRAAWPARPLEALRSVRVCADSGYPAGPDCPAERDAFVPIGAAPQAACPYCRTVRLTPDGLYQASAQCSGGRELIAERRFVLPPTLEWYYRRTNALYRPLPPWLPGCEPPATGELELVAPEEGAFIYVPIELDGSPSKTVFRAAHRSASARLFWHLDDEYLGETRGDHRIEHRPAPGRHELVVMDEAGNAVRRGFTVGGRD